MDEKALRKLAKQMQHEDDLYMAGKLSHRKYWRCVHKRDKWLQSMPPEQAAEINRLLAHYMWG
jgi:hypothetical protein